MSVAMASGQTAPVTGRNIPRPPLTTTHPHGTVFQRPDRKLALIRISKNASSELVDRLGCTEAESFDLWQGPSVAFFREPRKRFISSLPETMLRVTHPAIADPALADRVEAPEDIYAELCAIAPRPMPEFLDGVLDLLEYTFFDAHHEPQLAFLTDRQGIPRIEPHLYLVEGFEDGLAAIGRRVGLDFPKPQERRNVGGQKPLEGSTPLRALVRKATRTGLYRQLSHAGPLGHRYGVADKGGRALSRPFERRELNALDNRFAKELKETGLSESQAARVDRLYEADGMIWRSLREEGTDRPLSDVMRAAGIL